jgi:hypothetical protein
MDLIMKFTVGGRPLEITWELVVESMSGEDPEQIREHVVEMLDTVFPPKQVLATVTGWDRQSFTTMEAQRVLARLGFVCRRAGELPDGQRAWTPVPAEDTGVSRDSRLASIEAALVTAQAAIAGLHGRVAVLESRDDGAHD